MSKVIWKRQSTSDFKVRKQPKKILGRIDPSFFKKIFHNKYVRMFFGGLMTLLLAITVTNLLTNQIFKIDEFKVYGIEQISQEDILSSIDKYKDSNFFSTNPDQVENDINSSSIFFKSVFVEKVFPNELSIYVIERYPEVVIINFKGAYLVDQEEKIVKVLSTTEGYDITQEERELLANRLPLNSNLIEDKLKEELSEEEEEEFDIEEVDEDAKEDVYNQLRSELISKLRTLFERNSKGVSTTEFANLDRVFFYDNSEYKEGDDIDTKFVDIAQEATNYLRSRPEVIIDQVLWRDKFTLVITTSERKRYVFSDRKDIFRQLEDLDYMINYLNSNRSNYSVIDLTSEIISVR